MTPENLDPSETLEATPIESEISALFPLTRKILHQEWVEVTIQSSSFFTIFGDRDRLSSIECCRINFENGTWDTDEGIDIRNGRLYVSSYNCGIVSWDEPENQYTSSKHGRRGKLGQFVSAEVILSSSLYKALNQFAAKQSADDK